MKNLALLFWVGMVAIPRVWGAEPGWEIAPADSGPLEYVIIATGGELLDGTYADAHTPFLTRILHPLGCRCVGSILVDDESGDLKEALHFATNRAPLVIVTGGLGPTANDITRETLSEFTGIALREDSSVLATMEQRFHQSKDQIRPNLRRQTLVPARGGYLKNPAGTAVGLIYDAGLPVVVALPGPPRELQPMARDELVPFLQRRFGVRRLGASVTLRFVGVGQSMIDQVMRDHISTPLGLRVISLFEQTRVDFTFSLPGNTAADRAQLAQLERDIRGHLGQYIYANDGSSLEEVVLKQMRERADSLVLVDVGTGGHLVTALSQANGASPFLVGAFVAPTEGALARLLQMPVDQGTSAHEPAPSSRPSPPAGEKVPGGRLRGIEPRFMAGEQVQMEQGASQGANIQSIVAAAARSCGSRWAIGVGAVEMEAGGGSVVWLVCQFPDGRRERQQVRIRGRGELAAAGLTTQILDTLRRQLP